MSTTKTAARKKAATAPAPAPVAALRTRKPKSEKSAPERDAERSSMRTLELVFFVHLQMADIADQVLAGHGLGRPHHRVLHFAGRVPGITVGSLMSLLRISNQALSRTTNQLTSMGLLEQRYSVEDRRVRQNHLTAAGKALLDSLTARQIELIGAAQAQLSQAELEAMWNGLTVMVRPEDMAWVTTHPIDSTIP